MRRLILLAALAATTWSLGGCGGSEPPKNTDTSTPKAPDVPKDGP